MGGCWMPAMEAGAGAGGRTQQARSVDRAVTARAGATGMKPSASRGAARAHTISWRPVWVDGEESDKISEQRTRKKRRGGLAANLDFDSSLDENAALHSPERASSKSLSDSLRNRKPSRRRAWAARREQAAEADRS